MGILWTVIVIYAVAGTCITAMLVFGVAQAATQITIMGRIIDPRYTYASLLVMAFMFWWLVLWIIIAGRQADAARPGKEP